MPAARDASRGGIGREFLFQAQTAGEPVNERVVEMEGQPKLGEKMGRKVAAANMCDLMGQNGP
jgi:hypothetical protein